MSPKNGALRSGALARLSGVSPDTIRHYERVGILPRSPRTDSGYRLFPSDAVDRVLLVRRALKLGFTLAELSEILQVRDRGDVPCHRVLRMAEEKLRSLEQEIQELRRTQHDLTELVQRWKKQLAQTAPGNQARLLHSLMDKPALSTGNARHLKRRKSL